MCFIYYYQFRNHANCMRYYSFLQIYGVTQDPETKEYMIVMQYANNGSLLSYLDQNINNLTWRRKLQYLRDIAFYLNNIHYILAPLSGYTIWAMSYIFANQ